MDREDLEYLLHDFLEIHYGTDELENVRVVTFLMEHRAKETSTGLELLWGFKLHELMVIVAQGAKESKLRECFLLNRSTKDKALFKLHTSKTKVVWEV